MFPPPRLTGSEPPLGLPSCSRPLHPERPVRGGRLQKAPATSRRPQTAGTELTGGSKYPREETGTLSMRRCQKGELFISCASAACVGATRKIVYLTKQIKIFLVAPTQAAEAHERGHHLWLGILLWPGV